MEAFINKIKQDESILISELNYYGSKAKRRHRSCIHCSSSDALSINEKTNRYKCFSCGTEGNVIDLVINKENIDFIDAIKMIASRHKLELPKVEYTEAEKKAFKEAKKRKKEHNKNIFKLNMAFKEAKNITKKFEISCLIDNLENKNDIEKINHANYKADEIYTINKYISEAIPGMKNTIIGATTGNKQLLISPTGSGKTYESIKILKELNIKAIFVLPNTSNVEQAMIDYNLPGAYGNISLVEQLRKNNLVICTWDKLNQIKDVDLSEYIVLLDEVHQIYTDMFRHKAISTMIEVLEKFKGRIDITATPTILDFSIYSYIVEYRQAIKTNYKLKLYDNNDTKTVVDIINNSDKAMCLINDKSMLKTIQSMIKKKSGIITSDNKNSSELYKNIINNSTLGDYQIMLNTSCMLASFNIKDTDITDIIIVGGKNPIKDVGTIKQYVARPRNLKEVNVHIFDTYEEKSEPLSIQWLIDKQVREYVKISEAYNNIIKAPFSTVGIDAKSSKMDSYIYYDKKEKTHKIDKISIRAEIYKQYYKSRSIEAKAVLLEEYFTNIEIIKGVQEQQKGILKESIRAIKENKKNAKEILNQNKDILVGYTNIVEGIRNYKLCNYMIDNNINEVEVLKIYKNKNIHSLINDNNLKNMINLYTNYVLDYSYSYDLAWKLANMNGQARKYKYTDRLRNIIYEKIKTSNKEQIKESIPNKVYEFIIDRFKPGMSYTNDHLEILSKELTETFKDKKAYSSSNISKMLNSIYVISKKQSRSVTPLNINLYRNIQSSSVTKVKNRTRIYTIEKFVTIDDIKKELQLSNSDKSIEAIVDKKIKNLLDDYKKEKILESDIINKLFDIS